VRIVRHTLNLAVIDIATRRVHIAGTRRSGMFECDRVFGHNGLSGVTTQRPVTARNSLLGMFFVFSGPTGRLAAGLSEAQNPASTPPHARASSPIGADDRRRS
jgi:hypothetical protein